MTVPDEAATNSEQTTPTVPGSRYRCRAHPDYAVTPRGHGCLACRREPRRRRVEPRSPNDGLAKLLRNFDTQRG